jgi:GH25 family lysozyme M1 (1,4-beta-N-acetylmuramidase)/aspartate carbamoyltransferase regulatory subunit
LYNQNHKKGDILKNIKRKIIKISLIILVLLITIFSLYKLISFLKIKTARIEVVLQDDLTLEFLDNAKISDFIKSINGTIVDDEVIDSTKIGEKTISFSYINDDGVKVPFKFKINVVDSVAPVIWLNNSYTITKGNDFNISSILCGDNEDSNPNCYIEGEYDYNEVGTYPLTFKAVDESGNIATKEFNLNVIEPKKNSTNNIGTPTYTSFSDVYENYKNENTKIGIDVSGYQGDIDFEKIKNAGVEFIIIKVGGTKKSSGEYYVDSKFIQNITLASEMGLDVGIYFFSYANSNSLAKKDALWVLDQIKDYKVTLPIAFDWEDFQNFNDYNLSFFGLTDMANTFLDTITEHGYEGMIYGSKSYLEKIWLPTNYDTWLAHYTKQTNYEKEYKFWQICDDGQIDGIDGAVDIDIMYVD